MAEREGKSSSGLESWEPSTQFNMYREPGEVSVIRKLSALVPAALPVIHKVLSAHSYRPRWSLLFICIHTEKHPVSWSLMLSNKNINSTLNKILTFSRKVVCCSHKWTYSSVTLWGRDIMYAGSLNRKQIISVYKYWQDWKKGIFLSRVTRADSLWCPCQ